MKQWIKAIVCTVLACSLLTVVGCDTSGSDQKGETYYQNGVYHWTQTDESGNPVDFAKHQMVNGKCSVCGYEQHFTLSFDTAGGSSVASQSLLPGETAQKPADPTKSNAAFDGWFTSSDYTEAYDFGTPVTDSVTVYAKWLNVFHFTFDANGGQGNIDPITVKEGDPVPAVAQPTREGYLFTGWYTSKNTNRMFKVDLSQPLSEKLYNAETGKRDLVDCTLYAGWTTGSTIAPINEGDKTIDGGYYTVTGETEVTVPVHGNTFYFAFYPGGRSGVYTISTSGAPVKAVLTSYNADPNAWGPYSVPNTLVLTYTGNDFSYEMPINNIYINSPTSFALTLDGIKEGDTTIRTLTLIVRRTGDVEDVVRTVTPVHATATEKFTDNSVGKDNVKLLTSAEGIYRGEDGKYYRINVSGEKTGQLVYAVIGSPDGVENGFIEGKSIYQIPSLRIGLTELNYNDYRPMIEEYSGYEAYVVAGSDETSFREIEGGGLVNRDGLYPLNDELLDFFKKYCALQGSPETTGAYLTFLCYQNK